MSGADPTVIQPAMETEIDSLIRAMEQEERQLLDGRTAQSLSSVQRTQQLIIGGDVLGLLIGLGTATLTILAQHLSACAHPLLSKQPAFGSRRMRLPC